MEFLTESDKFVVAFMCADCERPASVPFWHGNGQMHGTFTCECGTTYIVSRPMVLHQDHWKQFRVAK